MRRWRVARRILLVALAACVLCCSAAQAKGPGGGGGGGGNSGGAPYIVVPFLPPGFVSTSTEVTDLNDQGDVIGVAEPDGGGFQAAHLDLATGVYTSLQGGLRAEGVNNFTQIVGVTKTDDIFLAAFWSSPSAEPIPLLPLPDDVTSYALAINDAGIIVGRSWDRVSETTDGDPLWRGVAWRVVVDDDETVHVDGPVELPSLYAGAATPWVRDINDIVDGAAQIVGDSDYQAVVWTIELNPEDGTLVAPSAPTPVGTPGAAFSDGIGINNLADVCGRMESTSVPWGAPFVALADDDAQPLPVPRRTLYGYARDINDVGEAVGDVSVEVKGFQNGPGRLYACLWEDGKSIELNKQIPSESGWDLHSAQVINSDGLIGGFGYFDGASRGFVLIPNP